MAHGKETDRAGAMGDETPFNSGSHPFVAKHLKRAKAFTLLLDTP